MPITDRNGVQQSGQSYNKTTGLVERFTEQMMDRVSADAILDQAKTDITPHDAQNALVRVHANPTTLLQIHQRFHGQINMNKDQLPDMLIGLDVAWNSTEQSGEDINNEPLFEVSGANGEASISASSSARASANVMPGVQPKIKYTPGTNLLCSHVFLYMTIPFTRTELLTRLSAATGTPSWGVFGATVSAWPVFRPVAQTLTLKGQQVSVSANANSHQGMSYSADGGYSWQLLPGNDPAGTQTGGSPITGKRADGFSKESGVSMQLVSLPPTINAAFTISPATTSKTATATVKANMSAITGTQAVIAVTNEPSAKTDTATGEISPAGVAATATTAIPTSGLYLVEFSSQLYDFSTAYIHAVVIDASIFA